MTRFPGVVTGLRLHEALDAYRRPFAFVSTTRGGLHTAVVECVGGGLASPGESVEAWVRRWLDVTRAWHDPSLTGITMTLDTSRPGVLRLAVTHTDRPPADPAGRKRQRRSDAREMAVRIGAGLPRVCTQFEGAVGGAANPLDAGTLIYGARIAFDPSVANFVPEGTPLPPLRWREVPPASTREFWDHVEFDGAAAATWSMKGTSGLDLPEQFLKRAAGITAMRLHIILDRPRLDARPLLRKQDDVALLLTATTSSASGTKPGTLLDTVPKQLAKDTRWRLRRVYGGQAAAFAAGLGLGFSVPDQLRPPQTLGARR